MPVKRVGKKMIRATDAKEVGVGNTAEETCRCPNQRRWFASGTVMSTLKYRLISNRVPSPVYGPNPGKNHGKKWRRGRDSNPRSLRGDNAFRVRPVRPLRHLSERRDSTHRQQGLRNMKEKPRNLPNDPISDFLTISSLTS